MYSEQIEQLIKSVIADGVITEKERAVLHKKAAAEGIDEDEIDVYVDGLIAQMKSDTSKSKVHVSVNVDFNHVTKFIGGCDHLFYLGQKQYCVRNLTNVPIQSIYLNFFKEIVKETNKNNFGISVAFIFKKGIQSYSNNPKLEFKTDTNRIQLRNEYAYLEFPPNLKQGSLKYKIYEYFFDEEMLKLLCDAEHVTMTLTDCGVTKDSEIVSEWTKNEKKIDIKDISVDGFATYAKVFYRSVIDNSAYPDAVIKQDESVADKKETDADSETLKVLTITKKVMNKVALGHKYYEQFAIKNSDLQFIEFDEKHSLSNFNSYIKVFSILKVDKPQFFLKVVYNYYEKKKNKDGEIKRVKKVMNLNEGSLKIICDGYTEVKLSPLAKSNAIFEKDSEMNFYFISEQDLRTILAAENVSINLYGSKLKSENIKHIGFSSKLPFVWKQALATLMGEDVPEKKTLFGKIKGLFN
jgi:hypothetical protein